MSVSFDSAIPAGNGVLEQVEGREIFVRVDLRDTPRDWFYWRFKLVFHEEGEYRVKIRAGNGCCLTERGPAVSRDGGLTWTWLPRNSFDTAKNSFVYRHAGRTPAEVMFCTSMQYLPSDLEKFLSEFRNDVRLEKRQLCLSRKGRSVVYLNLTEKGANPKHTLLVTSRHHACEMTATCVMEGLLREALSREAFLKTFRVMAVPFVDMDGVVEGDQGKWRRPHDHGRDYGSSPIYPETKAIMRLIQMEKPDCVLDLHCPYVCGREDSRIFLCGTDVERIEAANVLLSEFIERDSLRDVPYSTKDEVLFGTPFNRLKTGWERMSLCKWASNLEFVKLSPVFEIPYANSGEFTFAPEKWRSFGRTLARALLAWSSAENRGNIPGN